MWKRLLLLLLSVLVMTGCAIGTKAANQSQNKSDTPKSNVTVINETKGAPLKPAEGKIVAVQLNSGYAMPVLGLGTWTQNNTNAAESVYVALKNGYRLIDTARYYGNEKGVGEGLKRAIADGIVKREDVFITSKIMPGNYDNAAAAIDASLKDLQLDYLDLMLIHQPGSNDKAVYQAMEQGVKEGKLRSIGISNYYTKRQVDEVLSYAKIAPAVIQNENHIYYQNTALQNYVKQYGIVIECWYPFGGRGNTKDSFENKTIVEIANAHGKTPAQVILRWQVQAGYVTVPGSANPQHIAENIAVFDFVLSADEMARITALNRQRRYENW
ncbi:MAG: aldo/keto reductase [Acidaminococcaceae bacterium]|nr:aldo/keto reductase [Acidaminococcaceae bacterium]